MKKTLALVLALLLAIGMLFGCSAPQTQEDITAVTTPEATQQPEAPVEEKDAYTSGSYTVETRGRNGPMTVEVTFDSSSITKIDVLEHCETPGVGDIALEQTAQRIIDGQTLAIDAIATATVSSNMLRAAVQTAVEMANGGVAALNAAVEKQAGAPVEMNADVVVVGGGGAGMSAAVSAAREGASVILVEKTSMLGGNTLRSGGFFNAVVEGRQETLEMTPEKIATVQSYIDMEPKNDDMARWQAELAADLDEYKQSGVTYLFDSIYLHMLQTYSDGDFYANTAQIENLCTNAPVTYKWLEDMGFPWGAAPRIITGSLWQRTNFSTINAGYGYIYVLKDYIEANDLDVQFVFEVRADSLVSDASGKITGVRGKDSSGTEYTFNSENAVVLATGGFSANVEMREKYNEQWPDIGESVITSNTTAITGDGIVMAEAVGAGLVDMGLIQFFPVADPWTGETNTGVGIMTGPYVNKNGERYVDETSRRDVLTKANLSQPDGLIYIICSQANSLIKENGNNNYGYNVEQMIKDGKVYKADTLEELAAQIGVDPDTFASSIKGYNEAVANGKDELTGRTIFDANGSLDEGPFYATPRRPAVHHTMGGVRVDTSAHVLDSNGNIIPGLLAAGEVTGGLHGGNRLGGNAVADAMTNGRIAGLTAMGK